MGSRFLLLTQSDEALRGHKVHLRFGDELGERLQKELNVDGASDSPNLSDGIGLRPIRQCAAFESFVFCVPGISANPIIRCTIKRKLAVPFGQFVHFKRAIVGSNRFETGRFAISSYAKKEGCGRFRANIRGEFTHRNEATHRPIET